MNNSHGIVHTFDDKPILLSQLLGDRETKRSKLLKEKLVYTPPYAQGVRGQIKSKSAFYVLQLPSCTKAIKIGRALAKISDGIITRLGEYKTTYGNAKILYLRTFTYNNAGKDGQPASKYEKQVLGKIQDNGHSPIRGLEYFPREMIDEIKLALNNTEPNAQDNENIPVRRSGRNS